MSPPLNQQAHATIIDLMDDGAVRAFDEIRPHLPQLSTSAIRSIIHRLITDGEIDVVRKSDDSRWVSYRRNPSRRPFLLGMVCRQRLDAGVAA